jgi:hypothetical protein
MSLIPTRQVQSTIVEIASSLPDNDSGWTVQPYVRWMGGSEGQGQVTGDALLLQLYGNIFEAVNDGFLYEGITPDVNGEDSGDSLDSLYVRVLKLDGGSVQVGGVSGYTPFWYGYIESDANYSNGAQDQSTSAGTQQWVANGIAGLLGAMKISHGFVIGSDGHTGFDPGFMPEFNAFPNGDRSSTSVSLPGGTAFVHDLTAPVSTFLHPPGGVRWSARDIINLLLCGVAGGYDIKWVISDPTSCLNWQPPKINLDGISVLEAVNRLANLRRGLTWYPTVSGNTVTLNFTSNSASAIAGGQFYSLPAAVVQTAIDLTGDPFMEMPRIMRDFSSEFDIIEVRGGPAWAAVTAELGASFTADFSTLTGFPNGLRNIYTDYINKRWVINNTWNGQQYNKTNGLRNVLTLSGDDDPRYGWGGYTGARTFDPTQGTPPAWSLDLQRELPMGKTVVNAAIGPRQEPIIVYVDPVSGGAADLTLQHQMETHNEPPAVMFGSQYFWAQVPGSLTLLTLGFYESEPLRVSWVRDPSTWPRDTPRMQLIHMPQYTQQIVLDGTIIGSTLAGGTLVQSGDSLVVDHTDELRNILALMKPAYSNPVVEVGWKDRGEINVDTNKRPGALVTTVTTADQVVTANATITRRVWTHVYAAGQPGMPGYVPAHYVTEFIAQRVIPEVRAFR